ncbi:hypothetical protein [Cupriavidus sp. DF5525]|uniref:hypothetical protein n=1 Tax=Cupriavidus sp. DF5525 TaxID=3160989 RepID=UPI0032DE5782
MVFVEFDDYGNPLNRAQMLGAVDAASEFASAGGTVLVYVHGWHNDAQDKAPNVGGFKELIERASKIDRNFRPNHDGSGKILGIYVGWRGDSIPSTGFWTPLSYLLTFWNRKSAAHDIGASGGVYDLLSRLSTLRETHGQSRLLIHGHSFGAAVVFSTLSHTLMDQIRLDRVASPDTPPRVADLVLLVNPAFEAMKLRPQMDLARSQEYLLDNPPRLVIVTTEADWATASAFPLGRAFGTLFDAYADAQAPSQNTTALGHYIPYVTHQLTKPQGGMCDGAKARTDIPPTPQLQSPTAPEMIANSTRALIDKNEPTWCVPALAMIDGAIPLQLQRCDEPGQCAVVAGDHYIRRGLMAQGYVPYRLPIMNIRTTEDVSAGHTDIRNPVLENFVLQLLALALQSPHLVPMAPVAPIQPM